MAGLRQVNLRLSVEELEAVDRARGSVKRNDWLRRLVRSATAERVVLSPAEFSSAVASVAASGARARRVTALVSNGGHQELIAADSALVPLPGQTSIGEGL